MSDEGWRSFDIARASIWRIRSRVRLKCSPDLFEGAGLAPVETEAQAQDLPLALVERSEQAVDLIGEQRGGRHLERRLGRTVLDDVTEFGVPVLAQRLGQRQRLGRGSAAPR